MVLLLCCIAILLHLLGLPWWLSLVAIFAVAFLKPVEGRNAFVRGFLVLFISWFILCAWSGVQNNHIMAGRVALMFGLPNWWLLVLSTALIGGLTGGLAALAGSYMNNWLQTIFAKAVPK